MDRDQPIVSQGCVDPSLTTGYRLRQMSALKYLQNRTNSCYNPHEAQASYSSWPFLFLEDSMNPIPLAAAILVKAILDWWLKD